MNKYFDWESSLSRKLQAQLGIRFEDVVFSIQQGGLMDCLQFRNQQRAPEQAVMLVEVNSHLYLVPFIETKSAYFLQSIIPSQPVSYHYPVKSVENKSLDRTILSAFEAGELKSEISEAEKADLIAAAELTLKKDKRINIRLSSRDLEGIQRKALQEGMPYQTLIASILHKYLAGQLVDIDTKDSSIQPPVWRARPSRDPF